MISFIDLTLPITPGMPTNPDHVQPQVSSYSTLENEGWVASRLLLSSHSGTHVDAPSHFIGGASSVDEIPLDALVGEAQVVHLPGVMANAPVGAEDIGPVDGERVLIHTGWSETQFDSEHYFTEHPFLTEEAASYLVSRQVRLVGIDSPSVDYHPPSGVHKILLAAGVALVENLVNLDRLPGRCEITVLPLLLRGVDGSPVRAIAKLEDGVI